MEPAVRHRVLVVDDRAEIRALLGDVLALLDCDAEEAADGPDALARVAEQRYDLVVTDLLMPGMSGWQVVDALRLRDPGLPVIIMTGSATSPDVDRARAHGLTILHKPISVSDFATAVERLLDERLRCGG